MGNQLREFDIRAEAWREYELPSGKVYRIDDPVTLFYYRGATTHRVLDAKGVVHCVHFSKDTDVVLRWTNREGFDPVQF